MSDRLTFTILGCGSSGGVPRIGGHWGDCDPTNPKNRRRRCSLLVERENAAGKTTVLIDTSPDMRDQLLSESIGALDGVVYTHSHADHVHGIDDLLAEQGIDDLDVSDLNIIQCRSDEGRACFQPEAIPPMIVRLTLAALETITQCRLIERILFGNNIVVVVSGDD